MYFANLDLSDGTVYITGPGENISITYPEPLMAVNAYPFVVECCNRFHDDRDLSVVRDSKIYVYGEMYTWPQYLKKLILTAEKIGAKVVVKSR